MTTNSYIMDDLLHTGMGEVVLALNGVEFKSRHNDFLLSSPSRTSISYMAQQLLGKSIKMTHGTYYQIIYIYLSIYIYIYIYIYIFYKLHTFLNIISFTC